MPEILKTTTLAEGKFLRLDLQEYRDAHGTVRKWEAAQRQKAQAAVYIIARLKPSDRLVVIRQYRVPVEGFCIECPAGLIDEGETACEAAVRELKEETGYQGKILWSSGPTCSSAGMTGELVTIVTMEIDETLPENQSPKQELDEGEDIELKLVPFAELPRFLEERQQAGDKLDSRIAAYCAAMLSLR